MGSPSCSRLACPSPVPGSDWGCALQITRLNSSWRRPRYVFGIDGLQALHLAMKCAAAVLESSQQELVWLGEKATWECPSSCPTSRSHSRIGHSNRLIAEHYGIDRVGFFDDFKGNAWWRLRGS